MIKDLANLVQLGIITLESIVDPTTKANVQSYLGV